jgi:hypothetical protein
MTDMIFLWNLSGLLRGIQFTYVQLTVITNVKKFLGENVI